VNFKTQETLDKEIAGHRKRGTMDIFAMEQMGMAQSEETKDFQSSWIKYYNENDEDFVNEVRPRLMNMLIWDPSRTKSLRAADTGFVVWELTLRGRLIMFALQRVRRWELKNSMMKLLD